MVTQYAAACTLVTLALNWKGSLNCNCFCCRFIPRVQNKSLSPLLPTLSKKVVGGFKREKSVGKLTRAAVHTTTRPHLAEATS